MRRNNRDNNLAYLQNWGLVARWVQKQYGVSRAEIELMLYLHQIKLFTTQDFKNRDLLYSWNKKRFQKMVRDGWFNKVYEGNRRLGEHNKYTLSRDAVMMLRRIDRILDGKEDMPMSIRNKAMTGKSYSDKVLRTAILKSRKIKTKKET